MYNKGLSKLNNGDITQGIELLTRSVSVNKNNVPARNLLGLALFEIGYVGDALKHWVISQSLLKENNPANQYVDEARKNSRALEALNDAVTKYNQALNYIKQKSDDLAIIQLKRAVELNPRFVDALNLLALCHLIQNDKERAAAAAERVIAVDIQNPVALNYLSILAPGRTKPDIRKTQTRSRRSESEKRTHSYSRPSPVQEKRPRAFRFDIILALIIGAACSFAVVYILLFPAIHQQNDMRLSEYNQRLADADALRAEDAYRHAVAVTTLEQENANLIDEKDRIIADYDRQDNMIRFYSTYNLFRDGHLREAVDSLETIDISDLPPDLRDRADAIRAGVYPTLFSQYVSDGVAAFYAQDYLLALVQLENALRFMTEDSPRSSSFLFALGSLYSHDEARHAEARVLLYELRDRFPQYRPLGRNNAIANLTDMDE